MPSLVEQLQQESLNHNAPIPQLLRRAKLIAAKLGLGGTVEWVDQELNGYSVEVPRYRVVHGEPKAFNPYNGWIPIGGPAAFVDVISTRSVTQNVASLEALIAADGGTVHFPYSPRQIEAINRGAEFPLHQMSLHVDCSAIAGILDAVRSKVLDWAIELEKEGIVGSEVGFSDAETEKARTLTIRIDNFSGNFNTGDASGASSRINLGSKDNSNNMVETDVFEKLLKIADQVSTLPAREPLKQAIGDMKAAHGSKGFVGAYQKFMEAAANHMTVFAPVLPQLSALLSQGG